MSAILIPDTREAERLLHAGIRLVELKPYTKEPQGEGWNQPRNFVRRIRRSATGYGVPLEANGLCSIDPDNWELAFIGMRELGFDLEALMEQGVRTRSTRPGSGGRSTFRADGEIGWLKFKSSEIGTVLEFRAHSPNLQDCVPGLVYRTKAGVPCTQTYANDRRLDDAPTLPDALQRWWERCSTDLDFFHDQERRFFEAIGARAALATSASRAVGGKVSLAYPSPRRAAFNASRSVEEILRRHGYQYHQREDRWSPQSATGAPGVRRIPGREGLWASDHASDPLSGLFDAWTAHVVLEHEGDVKRAEAAFQAGRGSASSGRVVGFSPCMGGSEPKADGVVLVSGADLSPKPVSWLWRDWLALGKLHILAGAPGQGKTTLALSMAATVTIGGRWPDGARCNRGNVLVWSGEDDPADTLLPRLIAAGAEKRGVHFIAGTRNKGELQPFDPATDMAQLAAQASRIGDVQLIVVDPVVSAVTGDSHKNTEVRRALQPLVDLAASIGAALLGISHFSKGGQGQDPVSRVVGSVAFTAVARVVMVAAKVRGDGGEERRILARGKSNIGPDEGGFEYSLAQVEALPGIHASRIEWGAAVQGTARELLREPEDETEATNVQDAASAFLREVLGDDLVPVKVVEAEGKAAGLAWRTIRRASDVLGVVKRRGAENRWYWSLPRLSNPVNLSNLSNLPTLDNLDNMATGSTVLNGE